MTCIHGVAIGKP